MFKRSHHINLAHRWIEKPAELIRTELLFKRWHNIDKAVYYSSELRPKCELLTSEVKLGLLLDNIFTRLCVTCLQQGV